MATLRTSDMDMRPFGPGLGGATLDLRLPGPSFEDAFPVGLELAAGLVDSLSLQLHSAVHLIQLTAVDVSPTLEEGQYRSTTVHPQIQNQLAGLFFHGDMDFQWQIEAPAQAHLVPPPDADSQQRLALWWYLKAMHTPYVVDQFLFLWTALEVLSPTRDMTVTAPYRAECGHVIRECPECDRSTERRVLGQSHKALLHSLAVPEQQADALWRIRQVVHGANRFRSIDDVREIGSLVQVLRAAVLQLVKQDLGVAVWEPPHIRRVDGPVVGGMSMSGSIEISADDVALDAKQADLLTG